MKSETMDLGYSIHGGRGTLPGSAGATLCPAATVAPTALPSGLPFRRLPQDVPCPWGGHLRRWERARCPVTPTRSPFWATSTTTAVDATAVTGTTRWV